jgi:hypothetical protein
MIHGRAFSHQPTRPEKKIKTKSFALKFKTKLICPEIHFSMDPLALKERKRERDRGERET